MIPKVIHQTFINQNCVDVCPTLKKCQDTIKKLHPDFDYKFYNDRSDIDEYIKKNFNKKYYKAFSKLPKKIIKLDFFRYFVMYNEGGIYSDIDYYFKKPFDMLNESCVLANEWANLVVGNCLFASEPGHEFWEHIINVVFEYEKNTDEVKKESVLNISGPSFLTTQYNKFNKKNIKLCDSSVFNPVEFDGIKQNIINELAKNKKTNYNSCTILDHPELQKFLKYDIKSYGIHLCASSWTNNQVSKLRAKFSKIL